MGYNVLDLFLQDFVCVCVRVVWKFVCVGGVILTKPFSQWVLFFLLSVLWLLASKVPSLCVLAQVRGNLLVFVVKCVGLLDVCAYGFAYMLS